MFDKATVSRKLSVKSLFSRKDRYHGAVEEVKVDVPPIPSSRKEPRVNVQALKEEPRVQTLSVRVDPPRKKSSPKAKKASPFGRPLTEKAPGSYMFTSPPTLVRTPWELERKCRPAVQCPRQPAGPPSYSQRFGELPSELMHAIIDKLAECHSFDGTVDVPSLQSDLCSLSRTSKHCNRFARQHLYSEIWLPSNESERGRRLSQVDRRPSPLYHLTRTLNEQPSLAALVRHLRISYVLSSEIFDQSSSIACQHGDATLALIAQIVRLCPSLEHFSGFSAPDLAGNMDVWRALSSRPMLKSHGWTLDLDWNFDSRRLIQLHSGWQHLESLSIADTQLGTGTLFGIIWFLPNLRHLVLRGLFGSGIHCGTLMMLPALESLRLEALDGITEEGLMKLAHAKLALSLERLILVDMNVQSMTTIQILLESMQQLKRFALVQANAPGLDEVIDLETSSANNLHLSSPTLQELCWDTDAPGQAVSIIANSIAEGAFPALRKVRVPCDDEGEIQRFCHPIAQEDLTATDVHVLQNLRTSVVCHDRTLQLAQTLAQLRTLQSEQSEPINVVVKDEEDVVQRTDVVGCYMGDPTSRVEYSLDPGIPGCRSVVPEFYEVVLPATRRDCEQVLDLQMLF